MLEGDDVMPRLAAASININSKAPFQPFHLFPISGTMKLELADTINRLVNNKYLSAKSSGSLVFSSTELTIIRSKGGLPVSSRTNLASRQPEI
jgi:hypothetical protein